MRWCLAVSALMWICAAVAVTGCGGAYRQSEPTAADPARATPPWTTAGARMCPDLDSATRGPQGVPAPAPVPTVIAMAASPTLAPPAPAGAAALMAAFLAGYAAGGGPPDLAAHFADIVIPCESGWDLDPPGYHLGLAQFAPDTWARAARPGADYRDAWEQGFAVGNWIGPLGVDPAGTGGWANCW